MYVFLVSTNMVCVYISYSVHIEGTESISGWGAPIVCILLFPEIL
jgi:hypothetical protein